MRRWPGAPATTSGDDLLAAVSASARPVAWAVDELFHDIAGRGRRKDEPRLDDPRGRHRRSAGGAALERRRRRPRRRSAPRSPRHAPTGDSMSRPSIASPTSRCPLSVARPAAPRRRPSCWAAAPRSVEVIEALDHAGLWTRLFPEWEPARSRPQHNPYHAFTVDRHLLETVAVAATLEMRRPRAAAVVGAAPRPRQGLPRGSFGGGRGAGRAHPDQGRVRRRRRGDGVD